MIMGSLVIEKSKCSIGEICVDMFPYREFIIYPDKISDKSDQTTIERMLIEKISSRSFIEPGKKVLSEINKEEELFLVMKMLFVYKKNMKEFFFSKTKIDEDLLSIVENGDLPKKIKEEIEDILFFIQNTYNTKKDFYQPSSGEVIYRLLNNKEYHEDK
jgi:hypothetical protein